MRGGSSWLFGVINYRKLILTGQVWVPDLYRVEFVMSFPKLMPHLEPVR
jgi:hypothetical protein